MPTIVTERLILRPWKADDLPGLIDLDTDPEVMRYIRDGAVATPEACEERLARFLQPPERDGIGILPIEDRITEEFLGWAGLAEPRFLPSVMPAVEAGWRLRRTAWGRGVATEAARAAIAALLPKLDLTAEGHQLVSIRHVDNLRSERVMAKLGFRSWREDVTPETRSPVVIYRAAVDDLVLT